MKKLVHGIGVNDANYSVTSWENGKRVVCPFYSTWKAILRACYSTDKRKKANSGNWITCSSWLVFSNFKKWMEEQDWYGKHLNTAILSTTNVYSPENCVFAPKSLDSLLNSIDRKRGDLETGAVFHKSGYSARCSHNNKKEYIGLYKTATEASNAYKKHKSSVLTEIAGTLEKSDTRLRAGLLSYAAKLVENLK